MNIENITVYEQTSRGERLYDIYSRLLADRTKPPITSSDR